MASKNFVYLVYDTWCASGEDLVGIYCDRQTAEDAINGDLFYSIVRKPLRFSAKKLKRKEDEQ